MLKNYFAASRFLYYASWTLVCVTLLLGSFTKSIAASWQWQSNGANERVTINLDEAQGPLQAKRNGLHSLLLPLNASGELTLNDALPTVGKLMGNASLSDGGITLQLQNSAFGYVVRQPSPKQIVIDIFPDPLGARWQADGNLAPEGTKPQQIDVIKAPAIQAPSRSNAFAAMPPENQSVQQPISPAVQQLQQNAGMASPALPPDTSPVTTPSLPQTTQALPQITTPTTIPAMPPEDVKANDITTTELPLQEANGSLRIDDDKTAPTVAEDRSEPLSKVTLDQTPAPMLVAAADIDDVKDTNIDNEPVNNTAQNVQAPIEKTPTAQNVRQASSLAGNMPRGKSIGAQELKGSINTMGPEYWPEDAGLSTSLSNESINEVRPPTVQPSAEQATTEQASQSTPQPSTSDAQPPLETVSPTPSAVGVPNQDVRQGVNTAGKPEEPVVEETPRPVIYVDEEGNEVEKPPVPEELFAQAEALMNESKYTEAVPILEQLRAIPNITREMREQVLYNLSDALFIMYEGKPVEGFEPIDSATNEAMNVNLRSTRVPDALYRLGVINLNVGNFTEAEGYFKALKRRYPYDINIPTAFYLLGKSQFEKGLYADAEKNFRTVVQEYPDAAALDESTIGLIKALTRLKDYEEAKVFVDFAGMRWARYYVDDPDYINYLAEIDYHLGDKDGALEQYWLLYNLDPKNERSADVLAKIGDLYFEIKKPQAAMDVFGEIETRFPKSKAAALAALRRSEKGIYDSPINMAEMFSVFENPGAPLPQVVYKTLQKNYPDDKRSITAGLKYAIWQLWNREYTDAMGSAADFIDFYPENPDVELAKDVIMRGFMADLKNSLAEENYGRVLILWNGFPVVRERYGPINPELRNALGRGYLERGEDENAMEMLAEFLKTPMDPRYSEPTFALYFNKYLESGNWNGMLDLGELVKDWNMPPVMRGQLDYALALSAENLGLRERALTLWKELAENKNLQLYQRAYATYFLAKDAEERQDIKQAYAYNIKTLELFETLQQERSDRADTDRIKEAIGSLMDITEVSNRIPEALEWVEKYGTFVPEDSPEYPGLRFREARLYRKLGNDERARLLLEIIVNNYASSPFAAAASSELSTFEMSRDLRNFLPGGTGSSANQDS